jgi:hypothetical protein
MVLILSHVVNILRLEYVVEFIELGRNVIVNMTNFIIMISPSVAESRDCHCDFTPKRHCRSDILSHAMLCQRALLHQWACMSVLSISVFVHMLCALLKQLPYGSCVESASFLFT